MKVVARSGTNRGKPNAVIEVSDSGTGFPVEDAERVFRRFQKASDSSGSGLGLTIARAIVEAHHGTLTARSDGPGNGAVFTMTLPAGPAGPRRFRAQQGRTRPTTMRSGS